MTINVDDLTLGQIKEISKTVGVAQSNTGTYKYIKGQKVCIRGVTMIYTGVVEEDFHDCVTLSSACWIADTGRWSEFLKNPTENVNEAELYPKHAVIPVYKGVITDSCVIEHVVMETK